MAERNVRETIVTPEVPDVIPAQELYVYVPIATAEKLGIVRPGSGLSIVDGIVSINDTYVNNLITIGTSDKQDKTDENINQSGASALSTDKTVVGNINNLYFKILADENTLTALSIRTTNAEDDITLLGGRVTTLESRFLISKTWIGSMQVNSLPTDEQLNNFVYSKVARQPRIGDTVIVIHNIANDTDKNYEYFYSENDWDHYEIPLIEPADNGSKGIVEGTYTDAKRNEHLLELLVNISGGQIQNIYVQTTNGYVALKAYIESLQTFINNIINGTTEVGRASTATTATTATSAIKDSEGNVIKDTYQTVAAGASKDFVKNYALPRSFNDVSYLSGSNADQFSDTVPANPGISYTSGQLVIGENQLCQAVKQYTDVEFEIGPKNGYFAEYYVTYDSSVLNDYVIVTFILKTEIYIQNTGWVTAKIEETNAMTIEKGATKTKVSFNSNFSSLIDLDGDPIVYNLVNPQIRQTLYAKTTAASAGAFTVYSSADYPSVFYLTTSSVVQYYQQGELGQILYVNETILNAVVNNNAVSYEIVVNNPLTFSESSFVAIKVSGGFTGQELDEDVYGNDDNLVTLKIGNTAVDLFTATNFKDLTNKPTTLGMLKASCFVKEIKYAHNYALDLLLICYFKRGVSDQMQFSIVGMNNNAIDIPDIDLSPYAKKLDVFGNDATIAVYDITTANTTITLQRLTGLTSIDWGDGTVTGSTVLSHTYVDAGKYVVLIYGVTAFGDTAFGAASGGSLRLYRIKFASYVSSLGQYALRNTGLVELDIPDTITSLGAMVCWNAATLKKVSIGTGVAALNQYSFYECYALSEVELSKPINIANNVFDGCTSLAKVYLKGTKAEWEAITIGTGNTPLQNATKYYLSDGSELGANGTATLAAASWSNNTYTLTVSALGANDAIFITPATAADKALMEAADIFITAGTGSVTFTATTTPTSDIAIKYFISRGA